MSFLGVDLGASFLKGAVLDPASSSIRSVIRLPFPEFLAGLPPGHREVDPAAIRAAFQQMLELLLQAEPQPEGIVLCSQMHGFIFVDEAGQPRSNYVSWQDQRPEEIDSRTGESFVAGMLARLSEADQAVLGREVRCGLPSSQLFRLARQNLLPSGVRACSLADFIVAEACGQGPVSEITLAGGHGLLDVQGGVWARAILEKLDLPLHLLPPVVPTGTLVGTLPWQDRGIPCYTPVGDQQCALLGVGLREDELSLNIATGSQVSRRDKAFSSGAYQVRPYFDGEFLHTITHIPAGRSLQALIRLCTELHPGDDPATLWEKIIAKVEAVPDTDLQAELSFFPGAFGSQGAFTHVREENLSVGHVFLAALENMANHYGLAAERLGGTSKGWTSVVLSGGLAQKLTRLQTLIQRRIPQPQRLPPFPEDTLRGLLVLATWWSGQGESLAQVQARLPSDQTAL